MYLLNIEHFLRLVSRSAVLCETCPFDGQVRIVIDSIWILILEALMSAINSKISDVRNKIGQRFTCIWHYD